MSRTLFVFRTPTKWSVKSKTNAQHSVCTLNSFPRGYLNNVLEKQLRPHSTFFKGRLKAYRSTFPLRFTIAVEIWTSKWMICMQTMGVYQSKLKSSGCSRPPSEKPSTVIGCKKFLKSFLSYSHLSSTNQVCVEKKYKIKILSTHVVCDKPGSCYYKIAVEFLPEFC